jgi:O-antigen/teichoic acid export membrane protein
MIKEQAIKGIKWTSVSSLFANLLQLTQLVIVSRFISATDYGLMSLTLVITYFAQLLGDMGISNALIYKQQISKSTFSSLFWMSFLFCWLIFGILFFLSPCLASFFNQPALKGVIRITAVLFIFLPLQMQYLSLLRKELQFDKIAFADIFSKLIALIVAVILAKKGYGVFSLVYSTLVGLAVSTLIFYYWGSRQLSIGFDFKISEIREFLHFGIYQTGNDILNYFNFQADTLLLGKLLSIDAVGYYSFAKNLAMKPAQVINPVITQVAFPLLAKVNDNAKAIKNIYLKMLNYLSTLNFLIYPFIAALSGTIIRLFFDEKWLPAAPALQALAFYCMIRSVFNPVGVLLGSRGMVKKLFYWNVVLICVIPVIVYFSAFGGITRVAIALTAVLLAFFIPMWKYLVYPACEAGLYEFWQCVRNPLISAVLIFLLLTAFNMLPIASTTVKFSTGILVWVIACVLVTRLFNKQVYREALQLMRQQVKSAEQLFRL